MLASLSAEQELVCDTQMKVSNNCKTGAIMGGQLAASEAFFLFNP
jgi:hypothetical protein